MRRTIPFAVAVVAAIVAVLGVMAFPGVGIGAPDTIQGGPPSAVVMNTEPEVCADGVDMDGFAFMRTDVDLDVGSDLVVYFTSEFVGVDARTEVLLAFELWAGDDFVASTPFEWGLVGNATRAHSTATVMWSFTDIREDVDNVRVGARVDPVPGPLGGGHPSATLENCALTVFVIP